MINLKKEVCPICAKYINTSQIIVECYECDCVMHHKCYKKFNTNKTANSVYCPKCCHLAETRYTPFDFEILNDKNVEADETLVRVNQIHNTCKSYNANEFNTTFSNDMKDNCSVLFQNIDGNKSNFDSLALETRRYISKFSIIALAETNIGPECSDLYQLSGYNSFYQNTIPDKSKGTGVALYICDSLSATIICIARVIAGLFGYFYSSVISLYTGFNLI